MSEGLRILSGVVVGFVGIGVAVVLVILLVSKPNQTAATATATSAPAINTVAAIASEAAPTSTAAGADPTPTIATAAIATLPAGVPLRYAAIGASDTVGLGTTDPASENWTAQLAALLPADTQYQRFARSGITLGESLSTTIPSAIEYKPNMVTMWLVVNDAIRGVAPTTYSQQLKTALDELTTQTDATIFLLNAPDISYVLHPDADDNSKAQLRGISQAWNKIIADTIQPYGSRVVLVDLFGASEQTQDHPEWISGDHFHPSVSGYQQLAQAVYAAAKQTGLVAN